MAARMFSEGPARSGSEPEIGSEAEAAAALLSPPFHFCIWELIVTSACLALLLSWVHVQKCFRFVSRLFTLIGKFVEFRWGLNYSRRPDMEKITTV